LFCGGGGGGAGLPSLRGAKIKIGVTVYDKN
jgi:hypothetical protein